MAKVVAKLSLNKTPQSAETNSLVFAKNIRLLPDNIIGKDNSLALIGEWEANSLVGHIVGNNGNVYLFFKHDIVCQYNDITKELTVLDTKWKYNGGKITGVVSVNNTGEEILTICEYFDEETTDEIPIKHINLSNSYVADESLYSQAPTIPITNLTFKEYYDEVIPCGTYSFFVRYKIRDHFYTSWFPCSDICFAGSRIVTSTIQGQIKHVDLRHDAGESFVFNVNHLFDKSDLYESYQIGFVLNSDNGRFARSWKHFSFGVDTIYFDYNKNYIQEVNLDEMLENTYEVFNAKNITSYKNKLYVANYKESNLNPTIDVSSFKPTIKTTTLSYKSAPEYSIMNVALGSSAGPLNYNTSVQLYDLYNGASIKSVLANLVKWEITEDTHTGNSFEYETSPSGMPDNCSVTVPRNVLYEYTLVFENETETFKYSTIARDEQVQALSAIDYIENIYDSDDLIRQLGYSSRIDTVDVVIPSLLAKLNQSHYTVYIGTDGNVYIKVPTENDYTIKKLIGLEFVYANSTTYIQTRRIRHSNGMVETDNTTRLGKTKHTVKLNLALKEAPVSQTTYTASTITDTSTILPFVKYSVYVHFVKNNGVATNGFKIGDVRVENIVNNSLSSGKDYYKIEVKQGNAPAGYVGCFYSIAVRNNQFAECFNHKVTKSLKINNTTYYEHIAECIELDNLLYLGTRNLRLVDGNKNEITDAAEYIDSGKTELADGSFYIERFGSTGVIRWISTSDSTDTCYLYKDETYDDSDVDTLALKKVSSIFKLQQNSLNQIDYNIAYVCDVKKLDRETAEQYYVSGADVYDISRASIGVNLNPNDKHIDFAVSETHILWSAYNLNYLSLVTDITAKQRSITNLSSVVREVDHSSSTGGLIIGKLAAAEYLNKDILLAVDSLTSSYSTELTSMYKDIEVKTYSPVRKKFVVEFNNTLRCSTLDVDELYRDIFKFSATDYYNIPVNRGIIVNIFSVMNKLYVHTQHSMFNFVDSATITSEKQEEQTITLQESDIFNSGVKEVFDSLYGFGGLQKKEHSLVTVDSYIFYDKIAKTIYGYAGENQIAPLSNDIKGLLEWFNPEDVCFASDLYNNRFFVNLKRDDSNICLSYNFISKSFISIHDMDFDISFNTRSNTYFQKTNPSEDCLYDIDYRTNNTNAIDYGKLKQTSALVLADVDDLYKNNANLVASVVDVVCNIEYETIKVLNWINWVCKATNAYLEKGNITASEIGEKYAGNLVRIYSDQTYSELMQISDTDGKPYDTKYETLAAYKHPTYNCGVWSMNYFRDIKNMDDVHGNISDNRSLIYGKYFVLRLVFDKKNFKLENVKFNMNDYGKTK